MTTKNLSIEITSGKWAINIFRDGENTIELQWPDKSRDVDRLVAEEIYAVAISTVATEGTSFKVKIGSKVICDAKTDNSNSYAKVHFTTI